jgi:RNA polymerase sigma factor (TIGR02999 family)
MKRFGGNMSDVTAILDAAARGDPRAADQLLPLVYDELRRLAAQKMATERAGHTLQATALVHEAYVRLVNRETPQQWDGRRHFFAAAAEAMRRILVEKARQKQSLRRGGQHQHFSIGETDLQAPEPREDILALDEALQRLAAKDSRKARIVELRYFVGLTITEAADALGVSSATAERDWAYARAWLYREMADAARDSEEI